MIDVDEMRESRANFLNCKYYEQLISEGMKSVEFPRRELPKSNRYQKLRIDIQATIKESYKKRCKLF